MKQVQVQLLTTLELVVMLCVCSEALKLPITVRRNEGTPQGTEIEKQLQEENRRTSFSDDHSISAGTHRMTFPEQTEDFPHANYESQHSKINYDFSGERSINDKAAGMRRFYKYRMNAQPASDEIIVFPTDAYSNEKTNSPQLDNINSMNLRTAGEIWQNFNSKENGNGNVRPKASAKHSDSNSSIEFTQSLETLAHIVRQLLFRGQLEDITLPDLVPITETSTIAYDAPSELNVQEQSLYSGPHLQTQSTLSECPEGTKRTRNGSCQKPSRRLLTTK